MVRDWRPKFLQSLAIGGNISRACRMAKVARSAVYVALHKEQKFAAACEDAKRLAGEELEAEALERAYKGNVVLYRGRPVRGVREYDNKLLMELLRAAWPEKYGRKVQHDLRWPFIEDMIRKNELTLEQLEAIVAGAPPDVVLAMPGKGTVH